MKKRLFSVLVCVTMIASLTSCFSVEEPYEFMQSIDCISMVSIVPIVYNEKYELLETESKVIDNIDAFLKDFSQLKCFTIGSPPQGIAMNREDEIVIKITYTNGEYELINWSGQAEYTHEQGRLVDYKGHHGFDKEEFKAFIEKYLKN